MCRYTTLLLALACFLLSHVPALSQGGAGWKNLSLPPGTLARALVFSGDTMLVLGDELYRSTDRGRTWRSDGFPISSSFWPQYIALDRKGAALVGGSSNAPPNNPRPLWRRSALGSWSQVESFPYEDVKALIIDPSNIYYVATLMDRLYRSQDDGQTWTMVVDGDRQIDPRTLTVFPNGRLMAWFKDVMKYSDDHGDTWQDASISGFDDVPKRILRYAHRTDMTLGVFGYGYLVRTTNAGRTWDSVGSLPYDEHRYLEVATTGPGRFLALNNAYELFQSNPTGTAWTKLDATLEHNSIPTLVGLPNGETFAVANGGPYRSEDTGATWLNSAEGIEARLVEALAVRNGSELFVSMQEHGLVSTADGGATWRHHAPSVLLRALRVLADGSVVGKGVGGFWLVHPDIDSVRNIGGPPFSFSDPSVFEEFAVSETTGQPVLVLTQESAVVSVSDDLTATWKDFRIEPRTFDSHVATSRDGYVYATVAKQLYRARLRDLLEQDTTDWEVVFYAPEALHSVFAREDSLLVCASETNAWFSGNAGGVWRKYETPVGSSKVRRVAISGDTTIYALLQGGYGYRYYSTRPDAGVWKEELTLQNFSTNAVFTDDGKVYVGGRGDGVFGRDVASGVGVDGAGAVFGPAALSLHPNPGDETVQLEFRPAQPGRYAVRIVDMFGRVCLQKPGLYFGAGVSRYPLVLGELPAGQYLCEVYAEDGGVRIAVPLSIVR